jgi:GNAT superfamily N-acetyltransferase
LVPALIRSPRRGELESLRDIERAAGVLFIDVGLPEIAAHEPSSVDELAAYMEAGRAWVVVEGDVPVGYALVDFVDDAAHLEQLSVHPDHGRRGRGSALLGHVADWARARRLPAVTLTTFRHVPWNAPFYARRGFRVLEVHELGPGLRLLRDEEGRRGLDPAIRVCMRREL